MPVYVHACEVQCPQIFAVTHIEMEALLRLKDDTHLNYVLTRLASNRIYESSNISLMLL